MTARHDLVRLSHRVRRRQPLHRHHGRCRGPVPGSPSGQGRAATPARIRRRCGF
ncbi:MAG: hypothetical protein MZW92_49385 [Comamonadaceae bacterium]|nr:hypothetical protein [Comamonadaceae bacterium]